MSIQHKFKAAKQGHLDGACGFYAIANAIHLLEPELDQQEIFYLALQGFLEDGNPMRFVEGTRRGSVKDTLSRVLEKLQEKYDFDWNGTPYHITSAIPYWHKDKVRTRKDVIDTLEWANYKQGKVIIMGYTHQQNKDIDNFFAHWTVVKMCKDANLYTFDSGFEEKKIPLDHIRVDAQKDQHSSRPYNIASGDFFQIWRQ